MPTGVVIGDNNKFMTPDGASPRSNGGANSNPNVNAGVNGNGNGSVGSAGGGQGTWVMGTSMGAAGDGSMGYLPGVGCGGFSMPETALAFGQALTALQNSRMLLDQLKAYDSPDMAVVECAARLNSCWSTILER